MRKLFLLVMAVFLVRMAQAQSAFDEVFGHAQVMATGYYNPVGADAVRNGCSDWLSRSPGNGGCYISKLYHTGQDMIVVTPNYADGTPPNYTDRTPGGIGHQVYVIADGMVTLVSRGISGDRVSPTPGYFAQSGYVSTVLANWGTTKCETIENLTSYRDPVCGSGVRKYNVAVIVRHKLANRSGYFWAVYGHVLDYNTLTKRPFQNGDIFVANQSFAFIGDWAGTNGRHLHFGIFVPNTSVNYPSIPTSGQKFGLANDTDFQPASKVNWPETYGFTDPIQWLITAYNAPDNYISAAGLSTVNPKISQTSVPTSLAIPQGGVGQVPFNLQSVMGFVGTVQGNAITTPSSLLSLSDRPKVLGINETVQTQSLIYVPNFVPLGTYTAKVQTVFQDNSGNVGATPAANMTVQVVFPPSGSGSGSAELYQNSLFSDPSLMAYYRLENGGTDSKGGNTLANNNGVAFTAAQFGSGASLGAGNVNKTLAANGNLGISTGAFTLHAWVKLLSQPGTNGSFCFIYKGDAGSNVSPQIHYNDSNGTKQLFFDRSKQGLAEQGPTYNVDLGTTSWHMIDFTYDGTNIHGYLDGVDVTGAFSASGTGGYAASSAVYLGAANLSGARAASVLLDDLAIFSRALSATEVYNLYNSAAVISPPAISAVGTSGGMTVGNSFKVYVAATSVDPANIQGLIYGPGCPNGCTGSKVDATTTSYVGSFVSPSQPGTYQLQFRNGAIGPFSNSKDVVVYSALAASCVPSGTSVSVNTPVTYTATVSGGLPPYSISWENGATGTGTTITTTYPNGGYLAAVDLFVTDFLGNQTQTTCGVQVQLGQPSINLFGVVSSSATAGTSFDGMLSGLNFDAAPGNLQVWFCQSPNNTTCYRQPGGITVITDDSGSTATVTGINLSAGNWVAKVRNGVSGTWSNLSNSFTVNSAATSSVSAGLASTSLYSDPSLVCYLPLDGNSSASKGNCSGTDTSVTYVPGKFGQGASFNGSTSVVSLGDPASMHNQAFTAHAWVYLTSPTDYHPVFLRGLGTNGGMRLVIRNNTAHDMLMTVCNGNFDANFAVPYTFNLNTWYMVDFTYDGTSMRGYVNGAFIGSPGSGALNWNGTSSFKIGGSSMTGSIDDAAWFSRALSATEVASIYSGGTTATPPPATMTLDSIQTSPSSPTIGIIRITANGVNIASTTTMELTGPSCAPCVPNAKVSQTANTLVMDAQINNTGTFTVKLRDGSQLTAGKDFTVNSTSQTQTLTASCTVNGGSSAISVNSGTQVSWNIVTSGGTGSINVAWSAFSSANTQSLVQIPGPGTYNVSATVSDSGSPKQQVSAACPQVTVVALPAFGVSCSYSADPLVVGQTATINAMQIGGVAPVNFTINGVYLGTNNALNITPFTMGTNSASVSATDGNGRQASGGCSAQIVAPQPVINSVFPDRTPVGAQPFNLTVSGSGFINGSQGYVCGNTTSASSCYSVTTYYQSGGQLLLPNVQWNAANVTVYIKVINPGNLSSGFQSLYIGR